MARHPQLGILHPSSILIFVALVALWLLVWLTPNIDDNAATRSSRVL